MIEIKRPLPEQRDILPEEYAKKPVLYAYNEQGFAGYCVYDVEPDCVVFLSLKMLCDDAVARLLLVKAVAASCEGDFPMCRFPFYEQFEGFACDDTAFPLARLLYGDGCKG